MTARIHVVLDEAEKARYRRQAEREGKSLGAWLRAAAEDRLRAALGTRQLRSRSGLEGFSAECDERERSPEPDWEAHRSVIERSRTGGLEYPVGGPHPLRDESRSRLTLAVSPRR